MNSENIIRSLLSGMAWGSDEWLTLRGALRHAWAVQFYCFERGYKLTKCESDALGLSSLDWGGSDASMVV